MLSAREDGEGVEGMGEDVVVFALVFGLVSHELLGGDPAAERWLAFQILWPQ